MLTVLKCCKIPLDMGILGSLLERPKIQSCDIRLYQNSMNNFLTKSATAFEKKMTANFLTVLLFFPDDKGLHEIEFGIILANDFSEVLHKTQFYGSVQCQLIYIVDIWKIEAVWSWLGFNRGVAYST